MLAQRIQTSPKYASPENVVEAKFVSENLAERKSASLENSAEKNFACLENLAERKSACLENLAEEKSIRWNLAWLKYTGLVKFPLIVILSGK